MIGRTILENREIFHFKEGETISEYCYRLYLLKDELGITWEDIAYNIYLEKGEDYTIDAVRKRAYKIRDNKALHKETTKVEPEYDPIDEVDSLLREMQFERYKLADERTNINAMYRRMSREDTIKEIALEFASMMEVKAPFEKLNVIKDDSSKEAILCISDVHYGLVVDSSFNEYNQEIAKQRLKKLLEKTIQYLEKENAHTITVVNLGDLIAGRIHSTIRLNSRIDVITQTMEISEILGQFLYTLSRVAWVKYVSTSDNHSRIEPKKSDSLELESLIRITDWYLKERCKDYVQFLPNAFGDDIATFTVKDFKIVATHGDKDKPSNVIQNMRLLTGIKYDLCLLAHRHHFSADETCGTVLVANGCVCGTDQFAQDLRLHSKPSQNLIIVSDDNPTECIYKINLD